MMLSISARGSASTAARYYEHLDSDAERGIEDYYADGGAGYYVGTGARTLNLGGQVRSDEFVELAAGYTPNGDAQNAGAESRRAGWDLTWSAPKSVSIVWGTASTSEREEIQRAHDRAVAEGLAFMERHAAFTRRGSGAQLSDSARREKVGLVTAVYRHGTSREMDPQLHSHAFVFNVAPRKDGTVGAIDSRPLYQWKMAAGAVYRAELAQGLKTLGYQVERDGTSFRIIGVPKELEVEFSKRRAQITAALKEHGSQGAKAAEVAALDTRHKKQQAARETLLESWRDIARALAPEWSPANCRHACAKVATPALSVMAIQDQLTRQNSTVSEPQLYAAAGVDRQIYGGSGTIESAVDCIKRDSQTITLTGRSGEERFTTREMQQLERTMVERAMHMNQVSSHTVSREAVQLAIDAKPTLSVEQKLAVEHISKGNDLTVVHGMAGTGKSFMLGAAREAWERDGYRVRGAALSGKAAQELHNGSGIQSTTLKRLEMDTQGYMDGRGQFHEPSDCFTSRDVVVVDEAGMVGSRQTAALLKATDQAGAKVILVGDTRQLQAIEAGSAFRAIEERVGSVSLNGIQRQQNHADREAVRDLAVGRADKALSNLAERERLHEYSSSREAKEATGRAVASDLSSGKQSLVLTATRSEARDVNKAARGAARETGLLGDENVAVSTRHGEREFSNGDRVLFTRNSRDLDIKNGDLGTIKSIERNTERVQIFVRLDRGGNRTVDTLKYDHFDHGYAVTVHKAQGSTVDRAHILASENGMSSREWAYVAGSRAREETHIYADTHTLQELAPSWSRERQKDTTLDYATELGGHSLGRQAHPAEAAHQRSQDSAVELDHSL